MILTDILTTEQWLEFQKNIYERSGLNVSVFDAEGTMISNYKEWANRLCPVIKGHPKGKAIICTVANNNISLMAKKSKKSVIEECDAGMLKIAVPVYKNDEYLGVISCCGLLQEGSEVDAFLIHKMTDINREEIENPSKDLKTLPADKISAVIKYIEDEMNKLITDK
jgi:ligand-binding sensor protein